MADLNDQAVKMNNEKDFTSEYRKSVEMDIPDLWDRINAGIDAREKMKESAAAPQAEVREFNQAVKHQKNANKKSKRNPAVYIMPTVAAVICIGVMVPLFMNGGLKGADSSNAEPAAAAAESAAADISAENGTDGLKEQNSVADMSTLSHGVNNNKTAGFSVDVQSKSEAAAGGDGAARETAARSDNELEGLESIQDASSAYAKPFGKVAFERDDIEDEETGISGFSTVKITVQDKTASKDLMRLADNSPVPVRICYEGDGCYYLVLDATLSEAELKQYCDDLKADNEIILSADPFEE